MTPQQQALRDAADNLAKLIDAHVPPSTAHWAVEAARDATARLSRMAESVATRDTAF